MLTVHLPKTEEAKQKAVEVKVNQTPAARGGRF
jgi:hypothetical protein